MDNIKNHFFNKIKEESNVYCNFSVIFEKAI